MEKSSFISSQSDAPDEVHGSKPTYYMGQVLVPVLLGHAGREKETVHLFLDAAVLAQHLWPEG